MEQQINLYTFIPVAEVNICSFRQGLKIIVIFVVLLLSSNAWQLVSRVINSYKLSSLAAKEKALTQQVAQLEGQIPEEEKIARAEEKINLLKKERRNKKNILTTLTRLQFKEETGYSVYLKTLASKNITGIQLTDFSFANGSKRIQISGLATAAELVPALLQNLSNKSVFANKVFEQLSITESKNDNLINFNLRTEEEKQLDEDRED